MIEHSSPSTPRAFVPQWLYLSFLAVLTAILGGCATTTSSGPYHADAYAPTAPDKVQVLVSLHNQMVYVMEGDRCLLVTPTTIGTPEHPTPTGHFKVYAKNPTKRSGEYGFWVKDGQATPGSSSASPGAGWSYVGYPMANWVEFAPGYGFHEGYVWPVPRSHGCLRLHANVAGKFFKLVQIGTPVTIAQSLPEDATFGKNVPRPTDYKDPDPAPSLMVSPQFFSTPRETELLPSAATK